MSSASLGSSPSRATAAVYSPAAAPDLLARGLPAGTNEGSGVSPVSISPAVSSGAAGVPVL